MSLHWTPVGPEPAATYWFRRAAVVAGLLIVLVGLVNLFGGDGDDEDTLASGSTSASTASPSAGPTADPSVDPSASPDPSASADPSADPSASPSSGPCAVDALEVKPAADAESYSVGATPRLSLSVTNSGTTPCTADLGQAQVEVTITSGSDAIWSSDHCAPGGEPDVVTLEPGEPVVQRVTWDGRRSKPGCAGDKAAVPAGTYRVGGRVGTQRVEGGTFVLTG
jgi:hypothetical protein